MQVAAGVVKPVQMHLWEKLGGSQAEWLHQPSVSRAPSSHLSSGWRSGRGGSWWAGDR